jgi:glycosyltransferase involved in cell wall biosynthesis
MKILHVIESDGGTVEFLYLLAKYSPETHHTVFAGKRAWDALSNIERLKPNEFPRNISMVHWEYAQREISASQDTKAFFHLRKWLRSQRPYDVLHLHSSKAGFLGRLAAWTLGEKRVVYTTQAISFIRGDISSFKRALFVLLEKGGHRLGGTVVCCSQSESEALAQRGIPSVTIPNGTEAPAQPAHSSRDHGPLRVISVGRATIQKNPALFTAIADRFQNNPKIEFIWVGDGELKEALRRDNIRMTGWLSREEVREELKQADIYLSTASWEGMPFAVLEAMAYGKPLVLTDCIGNKDLVYEQSNGFLFQETAQAAEQINQLAGSEEKRSQMGANSMKLFQENHEFRLIAARFLVLYEAHQR